MTMEAIELWLSQRTPVVLTGTLAAAGLIVFLIARQLIARGLFFVASRTANKYDDIIVERLRPFRFAWIAPLLVIHRFAGLLPAYADAIRQTVLLGILWIVILTLNALLGAVSDIYEMSSLYRGDAIETYTDLGKILLLLVGLVVTTSTVTGQSPVMLLSGLGALMAVVLLVFQDTILSFIAGLRIRSNDLIREGDALDVPSYGADGQVANISLHAVRIQNWDRTFTVIPTHKLLEVPYKNSRGIQESQSRRIKRALYVDITTVRFCDGGLVERLRSLGIICDHVERRLAELKEWSLAQGIEPDNPLHPRRMTNLEAFREYVMRYLRSRPDLRQEGATLAVRQLDPGPTGIPIEVYAYTCTSDWMSAEATQADIFSHLLAVVPQFGLRVFQEPSGMDFRALVAGQGPAAP